MGELEWTNNLVIRLMEEYQKRPELWNPAHEMYRVQSLKYESWRELASMFECDIADLRKKLNSLFASHRREKARIRAGQRTTWFLYDHMNFLPSHVDPDSGETNNSKNRPPVKEAAPPASISSNEEEDAEDTEMIEEHLELDTSVVEDTGEDYIMVKQELPNDSPESNIKHTKKGIRKSQILNNTHKPRLTRPIVKRRGRQNDTTRYWKQVSKTVAPTEPTASLDMRLGEALKLLRRADLNRTKDECDSFGEYIANSLRKHDARTQAMIKQAINNIIFEQEMKLYGSNQHYVVVSGMDENPLILGEEEK